MAEIFRKPSSIKLPRRKGEDKREQYGRELRGIEKCPVCGNVKVKKRWYRTLKLAKLKLKNPPLHIKPDRKEVCPACKMIKNKVFEGELFLESFPRSKKRELLNLIKNYARDALSKDPQDRIIKMENSKSRLRLITTENQMIQHLLRRIRRAYKNCVSIEISHSREPFEVLRAHAAYFEREA